MKTKQHMNCVHRVKERLRRARLLTRSHPVSLLSLCAVVVDEQAKPYAKRRKRNDLVSIVENRIE